MEMRDGVQETLIRPIWQINRANLKESNRNSQDSDKESACQCRRSRRQGFNPWVRNIPWRMKWKPNPGILLGKSHGQRTQAGYSPWGCRESGMAKQWHPTPVLLPGKSHGWRSLVGCSPWGLEESVTTERRHFHFSLSFYLLNCVLNQYGQEDICFL